MLLSPRRRTLPNVQGEVQTYVASTDILKHVRFGYKSFRNVPLGYVDDDNDNNQISSQIF